MKVLIGTTNPYKTNWVKDRYDMDKRMLECSNDNYSLFDGSSLLKKVE